MGLKSRIELYSEFINGAIPSEKDFRDLIDSMVNRRDDHFFGVWQRGMKYCKGDVVIHGKSLYLLATPGLDDCPPDESDEGQGDSENEDPGCICSTMAPDEDVERWCPLELVVDDKDWGWTEVDGEIVTVYNLKARVGIGTDQPKTRLEITDGVYGSIQLEPDNGGIPTISVERLTQKGGLVESVAGRVDFQLREKAEWVSDALGYAFFRRQPESDPGSIARMRKVAQEAVTTEDDELPILLFITSGAQDQAQIGIGTEEPAGIIDAVQANRGQMILNPGIAKEPGLVLVNLESAGNGYYLLSGISQENAFLQTDAAGGFRFKRGDDLAAVTKSDHLDDGESLLTITRNGDVGIGTEEPRSKLEAIDPNAGAVRLDLSNDNPTVSTINLRPTSGQPVTYHAFGVDDDAATFITNAPCGYVFKKGGPYGNYDNEVNINQGDKLVFIGDTGKVGIQTTDTPDDYDLEVNGQLKAMTSHLETDGANIEQTGELSQDKVLPKFDKLKPIKFRWKNHTGLNGEGDQYGFNAQNVFECFPELVKKSGGNKAVAYGNMTAVLVQAIKEQQLLIKQLEQRICDLEEQSGAGD